MQSVQQADTILLGNGVTNRCLILAFADCNLKWHKFWPVHFTMLYSQLYILTELSANDANVISILRQRLDLSKDVYLC